MKELELSDLCIGYENTADCNDNIHTLLTAATWSNHNLAAHRSYIENNKLGFGDPAFQSMWSLIVENCQSKFGSVRALEIGVYKGQIISLWSLLARDKDFNISIEAITPLEGQPDDSHGVRRLLKYVLSRKFREGLHNGNFYSSGDYKKEIESLFLHFGLDFHDVIIHKGYSTDKGIIDDVARRVFHILYVDGDHTFEGAMHDFKTYGKMVAKGGFLVADDAGYNLPGTTFWKGHKSVSEAAEIMPSLGFRNVLNVGHNRVYEKIV